jgi:hypothetical protein
LQQKDKDILRIIQASFNKKKKYGTVGRYVDVYNKKVVPPEYIISQWIIYDQNVDINIMLQYLEKFPLKTPKAFGINRLRLVHKHYDAFTYRSKNPAVSKVFNDLIMNFGYVSKPNETEADFLEKYKVPFET